MRVTIIVCRLLMLLMVRVRCVPVVGCSVHVPVRLYDLLLFGREIVTWMIFFVLRRVLSFIRWLIHIWIVAVLVWLLLLLLLVVIIHIGGVRKVRIGFYKLPVLVNVTHRGRIRITLGVWRLTVYLGLVWMWGIAVHRGYRHKRWILLRVAAGVRV